MAALEAAIQYLTRTAVRQDGWMAGSSPAMTKEEMRVGVARAFPHFVMAALEAAIELFGPMLKVSSNSLSPPQSRVASA